jgi:hypothetical protein
MDDDWTGNVVVAKGSGGGGGGSKKKKGKGKKDKSKNSNSASDESAVVSKSSSTSSSSSYMEHCTPLYLPPKGTPDSEKRLVFDSVFYCINICKT